MECFRFRPPLSVALLWAPTSTGETLNAMKELFSHFFGHVSATPGSISLFLSGHT
jgi:hypothetical protein